MSAKKKLPSWSLQDLYTSPADKKISTHIQEAKRRGSRFEKRYKGKLAALSSNFTKFEEALKEYEAIQLLSVKPVIYANLLFADSNVDPARGAFMQKMRSEYVAVESGLYFFELEIVALPLSVQKKLVHAKVLKNYRNYLRQLFASARHRLSEAEERLISDKGLTGWSAFTRLFDQETSAKEYSLKTGRSVKKVSLEKVLEGLHNSNRAKRKESARALSEGLEQESKRLAYVYNTLMQDKAVTDRYRKFKYPEDSRHLANQIEKRTVDAMVEEVQAGYKLVRDFYKLKRKLLGVKKLYDYDRYAPLSKSSKKVPWPKARSMVISAFSRVSDEFAEMADEFFESGWIDAAERKGKRGGAFCSFTTPDHHPYVFINYSGQVRDVFTLAHELGHAVHASLMRRQTPLNFDVPLTLAETASTFGEMLLFDEIRDKIDSKEELLALTVSRIESTFATVFRQVGMFLFERDMHHARSHGELSVPEINKLWRRRQEEMFGNSVELSPGYDYWWAYIPHFIHTPFYVYAYAFGELLSLSLYKKWKEEAGFSARYIRFLEHGNSRSPQDALRELKVQPNRREFWRGGIETIAQMVKDAKKLARDV